MAVSPRIPLFLLCFAFGLSLTAARAEIRLPAGLITADRVNVRAGPGGAYEVLTQLSKQDQVQVLAVQGEWVAVPLPEPVSAYVHSLYLEIQGSRGKVLRDRVHVRAGPGLSSSSFGFLSSGERVRVRSIRAGAWVEIQPPGFCRGWVHRSYVTVLESPPVSQGES